MSTLADGLRCADCSTLAGEPLAGTATRADRFLLLEHSEAWGRDALADTELPSALRSAAEDFDGRVLLVRRPGVRPEVPTVIVAEAVEDGGTLRQHVSPERSDPGEPIAGPLFLVCAHGRRDPCCARLGPPLYDALRRHVEPAALWQSSHQGGHRFAANTLVLPYGVQLGRVAPADAAAVAATVADGRIPLELYRGCTLYAPHVQAAEIALRRELGLDRIDAIRLLEDVGMEVRFSTPRGTAQLSVLQADGPAVFASCGVSPEPTQHYTATLESLA